MAVRYYLGDGWFLAKKTGEYLKEVTGLSDTEINAFIQNNEIVDASDESNVMKPRFEIDGYTLLPDNEGNIAYKEF